MAVSGRLTPWFEPEVKPVHVGVYQTHMCGMGAGYSYWTGASWCDTRGTVAAADKWRYRGSQNKTWRGLAVKP